MKISDFINSKYENPNDFSRNYIMNKPFPHINDRRGIEEMMRGAERESIKRFAKLITIVCNIGLFVYVGTNAVYKTFSNPKKWTMTL